MKQLLSQKFPEMEMLFDEPLNQYTYTKTGGKADVLVFPKTKLEAQQIMAYLAEMNFSVTILGNASNVIIRDGGISGVVIMLQKMIDIKVEQQKIIAQAGALLIDTSRCASLHSLSGLEFACGIPGSVGGAAFMNAGAYGGEVESVIEYVEVITKDGQFKRYVHEELDFSYRHSRLQETEELIVEVGFSLKEGNQEKIIEKMNELTFLRESKQPLEYPSCGSVFKRPEGHFTGKLIQDAGLQGMQIGGAQVSKKHAGFIVNIDHATASDYLKLIHYIQDKIMEIYGVALEPEVRIIGRNEEPNH